MDDDEPPLTEPVIIPSVYLTGGMVEASAHAIQFVGWVRVPATDGGTEERRIEVRFAMSLDAARVVGRQWAKAVRIEGGN